MPPGSGASASAAWPPSAPVSGKGFPPLPPSTSYRSGVSVSLTSLPTLANVSAVAVNGDGNGAAGGPVGSGVEVARARRMLHVVLVSPLVSGSKY